jgi:hypothetical protein
MYSPASSALVADAMTFFDYVCNVEYHSIVWWYGCVAGENKVSASTAA